MAEVYYLRLVLFGVYMMMVFLTFCTETAFLSIDSLPLRCYSFIADKQSVLHVINV